MAKCLTNIHVNRFIKYSKLNHFNPGFFLNDSNNISSIVSWFILRFVSYGSSSIQFFKSCTCIYVVDIYIWKLNFHLNSPHHHWHNLTLVSQIISKYIYSLRYTVYMQTYNLIFKTILSLWTYCGRGIRPEWWSFSRGLGMLSLSLESLMGRKPSRVIFFPFTAPFVPSLFTSLRCSKSSSISLEFISYVIIVHASCLFYSIIYTFIYSLRINIVI